MRLAFFYTQCIMHAVSTSPYWLKTHIVHFRFTQYARIPDQIYIRLINAITGLGDGWAFVYNQCMK